MEIKFGNIDINVKIPFEKYLDKYSSEKNLFRTMFSMASPNLFNNLNKKTPTGMTNYFEEFTKHMGKYTKMSKHNKHKD